MNKIYIFLASLISIFLIYLISKRNEFSAVFDNLFIENSKAILKIKIFNPYFFSIKIKNILIEKFDKNNNKTGEYKSKNEIILKSNKDTFVNFESEIINFIINATTFLSGVNDGDYFIVRMKTFLGTFQTKLKLE